MLRQSSSQTAGPVTTSQPGRKQPADRRLHLLRISRAISRSGLTGPDRAASRYPLLQGSYTPRAVSRPATDAPPCHKIVAILEGVHRSGTG